jgi:D-alanine-D-alanine ligase
MKILVLHSDIAADAPPEEQDTLVAAEAVAAALRARGHIATKMAFAPHKGMIFLHPIDVVFNLVESVDGKGASATLAQRILGELGMKFTGTSGEAMDITNNKPLTKQRLREAGLMTADWSVGPAWVRLDPGKWIVKSVLEDASIGLDDGCVVEARDVPARAKACAEKFGGRWFAEKYLEGREFNIAILGRRGLPRIMPLAEMRFENWPEGKPRIVGYGAKWEEGSSGWRHTVRHFGLEREEPELAAAIRAACETVWGIFDLYGFVRVDFRVVDGVPYILETNANPGIAPDAGFAAAAAEAGMSYADLIEAIVQAAL